MKRIIQRVAALVIGLGLGAVALAGLETVTHISDLNTSWPLGSDLASTSDNHIRNLKVALKTDFPNVNGAVNPTPAQFNQLTSNTFTSVVTSTGYIGGTSDSTITRFLANESITAAAHYAFVDDSAINYSAGVLIGHASFDSNPTFSGTVDSDHHHDYQATPHYGSSGTVGRLSSFYSLPDVTAGTTTELSEFRANDPTGAGTITTLYGLYVPNLTRGATNYAIFTAGSTPSLFNGTITVGNQAIIDQGVSIGTGLVPLSPSRLYIKQAADASSLAGYGLEAAADDSRFLTAYNASAGEFRLQVTFGSTGAYHPLTFWTSDVKRATIATDGGVLVGAPTGGSQSAGTVNATGLFVQGVAVATTTTGTFTGTFTGFTAANTQTCTWTKTGNTVTLFMPTNLATSNATTFTMTGLPSAIQPATLTQSVALTGDTQNNSTVVTGGAAIFTAASGTVTFHTGGGGSNWTAANNKGWSVGTSVTYSVQ